MERVAEFKGRGNKVRDSVLRNLHAREEDPGDACAALRADSMQVLSIAPESIRPCGFHGQDMGVPILLHGKFRKSNSINNLVAKISVGLSSYDHEAWHESKSRTSCSEVPMA